MIRLGVNIDHVATVRNARGEIYPDPYKAAQIAINSADARPSRFVGGERIDAAISEINLEKRNVNLSIKLLEELQNKEAVSKFSSPLSGKNLPFSSLSD